MSDDPLGRPKLLDLPHLVDSDLDTSSLGALYLGSNGYVYYSRWANGASQPYLFHRWVVDAPPGSVVDHINGDKLDNRRANLRIVTNQLNQVNRKRLNMNNTSGHRGVRRSNASRKNPWLAQIMVNRRAIYLGLFPTVEAAVAARAAAEMEHWGELCP